MALSTTDDLPRGQLWPAVNKRCHVRNQWYVGEDANQNVKLADCWVANLHASYHVTKEVQFRGS